MAPRPSGARRSLFPEPEHVYELGVAGRKTGVTLKDSGIRDEHGMQPLDDLFSSPHKPTEEDRHQEDEAEDDQDGGASEDGRADSEDMDITTTSGIAPAALLNGNPSRLPLPVNRSPVNVVVNSPARNRLMARSSSPTRGSLGANNKENYDRASSSQPAQDINTARRRLNFEALKAGARSLSQPTTTNGINGLNGYHDQDEEEEGQESAAAVPDETDAFIEESMAMLEEQPVEQEDEEPEEGSPQVVSAPAAKKKPGRKPKAKEPSPAPAPAKRGRKPAASVVEEEEEQEEQQQEEEEEEAEEEPEEVAPKVAAKRGRPAKGKAAAVEEPVPAANKPGRKRRTVEEASTDDAQDSSASRQSKRQRTTETAPAAKGRGRPKKSLIPAPEEEQVDEEPEPEPVQAGPSRKGKGRAPTPAAEPVNDKATKATKQQKGGRKRQPSPAPAADADADTSIAIPRGPPLPKSRGLVINRREVPGDSNAIIRTRSGRHSFKPLAYWRNEHVDYEYQEDEFVADHAPKASSSSQGSKQVRKRKFVLPTIKEVVRVEEEAVDFSRGRSTKGTKRSTTTTASRRGGAAQQKDQQDPAPPEPWELSPGILGGDVVTWFPSHEFHPPALDDEVEVQEKQLAISGRAIRTQKVKDAAFRYAKTVNEGFFGAGVVDLPPGAVKRPKNSRKMFMTFFVYTGRVLVTVNETVFRIGRGGMWFVPRGNYYSIENDYDTPARVFFSQGCEVQVRPSSEEGGEEAGGGVSGAENSMMDTSTAAAAASSSSSSSSS
ncbi:kinetochore CENP-C fungal-like protein, partial [Copromyces sp. CBS 386.78]